MNFAIVESMAPSLHPVIERELRTRARKGSTWHSRLLWGMLAIIVILGAIWWASLRANLGLAAPQEMALAGSRAFDRAAILLFVFALLSGVYFAADSLSREKREGTLGLLFMTELEAHDVVVGKALVMGVAAGSAVVAVIPILALPMLIGGVTPVEFRHVVVLLLNTTFFSLAAGCWISTLSYERQTAMGRTFLLLAALHLPFLFIQAIRAQYPLPSGFDVLTLPAPVFLLMQVLTDASANDPGTFWLGMAVLHLLGWICLMNGCWVLSRIWNEDLSDDKLAHRRQWWHAFTELPAPRRQYRRKWRLKKNPVYWLAGQQSDPQFIIWCLVALIGTCHLLHDDFLAQGMVIRELGFRGVFYLPVVLSLPVEACLIVIKALFAMYAARFFVEARFDHRLELLLISPLTGKRIARGNMMMLRRLFLGPVVWIVGMNLILSWNLYQEYALSGKTVDFIRMFHPVYSSLSLVAELLTLGWMSMWLAMWLKKPILASGVALITVIVVPTLIAWVPNMLVDLVILLVCRAHFLHRFRELAAEPRSE